MHTCQNTNALNMQWQRYTQVPNCVAAPSVGLVVEVPRYEEVDTAGRQKWKHMYYYFVCFLLFYILKISKVILEWVLTCDFIVLLDWETWPPAP